MDKIELSEEEIKGLREYVGAIKDNEVVDCVYIVPFKSEENGEQKVTVRTIVDYWAFYDSNVPYDKFQKRIEKQGEMFKIILDSYEKEFAEGRLSFTEVGSGDYSLALMNYREIMAIKELVSGIILFDRSNKRYKQKRGSGYFHKFDNILEIANIDRLLAEGPELK